MLVEIAVGVAVLLVCFLLFWRVYFLRDPARTIAEGDNIVSPADGKVIAIHRVHTDMINIPKGMLGRVELLAKDVKKAGYLISIFMSPFDVHVQRAPINGRVGKIQYEKGSYYNASTVKALSNEKNEILIDDIDSVKVIQIAGFVARRIECWVKEGDHLVKGDKIGRINLGSQVSIIIPRNTRIKVREGDRVTAGETVIADLTT